jgi:hypothetical protein
MEHGARSTSLEGLYRRLECPEAALEAALEAAPEAALEAALEAAPEAAPEAAWRQPWTALEAGRGGHRTMRGFISFSKISFAMIL